MASNDVFIVSAARTPIGSFMGAFTTMKASDLGSVVIKEVIKRANIPPADVSEIIFGQSLTAGQGPNPTRQALLEAGVPIEVPGFTVNMLCGSGLKSVQLGYQSIRNGDATIVLAGGQESMSQSNHALYLRGGIKIGDGPLVDTLLKDCLTDAMNNIHMGVTAENLAKQYNISREKQDEQAHLSQKRTEIAQNEGYFIKEIIPISVPGRKGPTVVSIDEYPKNSTTIEGLAKLKPCFLKDGTVTPGNSSGLNDGAAAVVLMSEKEVKLRGIVPLCRIVAFAQAGVDPTLMGIGVVPAVNAVLTKAGWSKDEVDLFEFNEAFAAQAIAVVHELGVDRAKVNVSGGAIALGHPIGASGTRVLVTLLHALERTNGSKGIASLCVGGGMGIAIAVERTLTMSTS